MPAAPSPRKTSWSPAALWLLGSSQTRPFVLTRGGRENLNPVVICILKHLNPASPPAWHLAFPNQHLSPTRTKIASLHPPFATASGQGGLVRFSEPCPSLCWIPTDGWPRAWAGAGEKSCLRDPPMPALKDHCISQGERPPSQESDFLARLNTGPSCFPSISLTGGRGPRGPCEQGQTRFGKPVQHLIIYKGRVGDRIIRGSSPQLLLLTES